MMQTNAEYMSDMKRVGRVVLKLMNMTLRELKKVQSKKYIEFITEAVIPTEGLSVEKAQDMTYIELACLIDHVGGNSAYDWTNHDSLAEQMCYYQCIAGVLLDGSKVSMPIKLFTALPLNAFYDYMYNITVAAPAMPYGDDFADIIHKKSCKYRDGYTIKDFLLEKSKALSKPWNPITPPEEYVEKMRNVYRDIGALLVNSFRPAFPERFNVKNVRDKYVDEEDYPFVDDGFHWTKEAVTESDDKDSVSRKEGN